MKVLWLCNIAPPVIAEELGLPASSKEGWISGLLNTLLKDKEGAVPELAVCFPVMHTKEPVMGTAGGLRYFGFYEDTRQEAAYDPELENRMKEIVREFRPDMIHIFGTEFAHNLALVRAFGKSDRTLVGIQGVCTLCEKHYADGVPIRVQNRFLLRDFIRQDNIRQQQKKFGLRGKREREILRLAGHITGRTEFDKAFCAMTHKDAVYYHMNETLRSLFYKEKWKLSDCERHTLFLSQGDYPLKGLHRALVGFAILKREFPDARLEIAGNRITDRSGMKAKLKLSSYGKYILDLIRNYGLEDSVTFLGMLDAAGMCMQMKKTHVFLNASSVENSPNSLGEAMLLGVPSVSSFVGGVPSMYERNEDGFCYPADEPCMMAYYVGKLWKDDVLAQNMGQAARRHALETHDPQYNYKRLLEIYGAVCEE